MMQKLTGVMKGPIRDRAQRHICNCDDEIVASLLYRSITFRHDDFLVEYKYVRLLGSILVCCRDSQMFYVPRKLSVSG